MKTGAKNRDIRFQFLNPLAVLLKIQIKADNRAHSSEVAGKNGNILTAQNIEILCFRHQCHRQVLIRGGIS